MSAGRLRHRVRFERQGTAGDVYGNDRGGAWVPFATVPADIRAPGGGSEAVAGGRLEGRVAYEIRVRWTAALGERSEQLAPKHRAVNARTGAIYNIKAVVDRDQRRKWLVLTCEAGGV